MDQAPVVIPVAREDTTRFLDALEGPGFPVTAAVWWLDPETDLWHLFVASPAVAKEGPRKAYAAARAALERSGSSLALSEIKLVSPTNRLVASLAKALGVPGPGWADVRVSRSTFDGLTVHDAVVLRATRAPGA